MRPGPAPLGTPPSASAPRVVHRVPLKKVCFQVASPVADGAPVPPGRPAFDAPSPQFAVTRWRVYGVELTCDSVWLSWSDTAVIVDPAGTLPARVKKSR